MEKIFENFVDIKDLYQEAKQSDSYRNLIEHGYQDISTERQQKNGTFQFDVGRNWTPPENFCEHLHEILKKVRTGGTRKLYETDARAYGNYGIFKYQDPNEEKLSFRVRTQMYSHAQTRHEVENSYEDAMNTIFRLFERLYALRVRQFQRDILEENDIIDEERLEAKLPKKVFIKQRPDAWWLKE